MIFLIFFSNLSEHCMELSRKSGILLHISSLPSAHGIGDFGPEAYHFVDQLVLNGFKVWQMLPMGPVGPGNSPYQAYSAYAGEPMFISLEELKNWGLLADDDLNDIPAMNDSLVDFDLVKRVKNEKLKLCWENYITLTDQSLLHEFALFQEEHNWWLTDYALYKVCKEYFEIKPWNKWEKDLASRTGAALEKYSILLKDEIQFEKFIQFLFFRQWFRLKTYANEKGIQLFGDLPLYVSHDSADVWGNQHLFMLDDDGEPALIGGVPPDYFSEDGQLWGNPVYNWDSLAENEYQWWLSRLYFNFHLYNLVRIDHFRGLESFWAVQKGAPDAKIGKWLPAKGLGLLSIMQSRLGVLPLIAEDLGVITSEVEELRDAFNFPGMKVLQFAFPSDQSNLHLPHNFQGRNVAYTGTHDNNTLKGWLNTLEPIDKINLKKYLPLRGPKLSEKLIEMVWASTAELAIVPMQDLLGLNGKARMNIPGTATGNWTWRYGKTALKKNHLTFFNRLNTIYNRNNG